MRQLVLAGGGHAHLAVLHALAAAPLADTRVTLVTPAPHQVYSGMVPGWMAGHYAMDQLTIDLRLLARRAGVQLLVGEVAGMDANRRCVVLPDGRHLHYDVLSLDTGSEADLSCLAALGDTLLPVKPLAGFVERWPAVREAAQRQSGYRVVVVGGGAAGVEIAFAARHALRDAETCRVELVCSASGLLPGHAEGVVRRVHKLLSASGIVLREGMAAGVEGSLQLADGQIIDADVVIAATGGRAPAWLRVSGLALDDRGFVSVSAGHASVSHPEVFAAGDVCSRTDRHVPRSGVHAVHTGPVLAHNLRAILEGSPLREYRPRRRSLYLLATGPRHAVMSWGGFSAQGAWIWRWKDRIDRRFIATQRSTLA